MQVLKGLQNAADEEAGRVLRKPSKTAELGAQVSVGKEVEREVQVLAVLEGEVHVDKEGVAEALEQLLLAHHRRDTSFAYYKGLRHFFHREHSSASFVPYPPYSSETAFPNYPFKFKRAPLSLLIAYILPALQQLLL
jgi:hypothetical protein